MRTLVVLAVAATGALALPSARAEDDVKRLVAAELPPGVTIAKDFDFTAAQVDAFAKKLGVALASGGSTHLDFEGAAAIQVNRLACVTDDDATRLLERLAAGKARDLLGRKGKTVVEFVVRMRSAALIGRWVRHRLGLADVESHVTLSCRLAPIARGDAVVANEVLNLALRKDRDPKTVAAEVEKRAATLTFGKELRFNDARRASFRGTFATKPAALSTKHAGDVLTLGLGELETWHGVPWVELTADLRSRSAFEPTDPDARDALDALVRPTAAWPADDEEIRALATKTAGDAKTPRERLERLHLWVYKNVKYGGAVGCRCGVKQVLQKKEGPCWDKSDVLVTLCRAQGLPARQLAGWVRGLSGHVWAEVYLEGQGWLPVDATVPWLGTSEDYFPYFATSDGELSVCYLSLPSIEDAR